MATVTKAIFTCDVCSNANDVQTCAFGFDGKRYEIDLCPEDSNGLGKVVAGYISKARKVTTRQSQRRNSHRPRSPHATAATGDGASAPGAKRSARGRATSSTQEEAKPSRRGQQAAKASGAKAESAGSNQAARTSRSQPQQAKAASKQPARTSRPQPQQAKAASKQAAKASGIEQEKGIYVYGILPADIEMAAEIQGVGEHPGPLGIVCSDGLAALISEVGMPERLGSPGDRRTHREILDLTATEVPVLPLRFGTVLTGEGAVADELLAPHRDEFAAALEQLEGRAQFLVKGRYVEEAATAKREEDTRSLRQAMEGVCVASVVREPTHELDAVHVAFLVPVDEEGEVERVIEDLAREWEGRIEVQLLGPMAAYDFVSINND